jgi:SWI/SNF-related matrix-associated actin-dependent regulator 1 of chromatin subfamily A
MLNIGLTKLKLDDAVGGEEATLDMDGSKDDQTAKEVRKSLLTTLRNKFEAGPVKKEESLEQIAESSDDIKEEVSHTPVKVARAAGKKEEL